MKSLSQIITTKPLARHEDRARRGSSRTFPQINYHLHAPAEDVAAVREQRHAVGSAELRSFRRMSENYFEEESPRGFVFESLVLAAIVGVVAWPIIAMMIACARLQ